MCCQHDEHSHNTYVTTTTKNRSKRCSRDSKFVQIMNICTTKGGNGLPSDVVMRISKKIIEDLKHQET